MSTRRPTRDTPDGRAYLDLRHAARDAGRDTAEYLSLYALECTLARLTMSPYTKDFVLKGGVLLAAFAARRPTRDIDLSVNTFQGDADEVRARVRAIVAIERADGIAFDLETIRTSTIRDEDQYAGIRVTLDCRICSAEITFHLDINFGDPVWPEPSAIKLPLLLGGELTIRGYPLHMVLAEKIATAIGRGIGNTRWRDFVDIATIARNNTIDGTDLTTALRLVAAHRETTLAPLVDVLDGMAERAQPRWTAWRRKQRLEAETPREFRELVGDCSAFADPAILGQVTNHVWANKTWTEQ